MWAVGAKKGTSESWKNPDLSHDKLLVGCRNGLLQRNLPQYQENDTSVKEM